MSDDRDFWRATTDWLEAGSDRTPPGAVNAVLLATRTTRQDRALPIPWRPIDRSLFGRVAIVAAAVVAVAFAWFSFGPSPNSVGVAPTPTPTIVPSPTLTPLPMPISDVSGVALDAGARYAVGDPFRIPFSVVAPPGWSGHIGGPNAVWLGPNQGDDIVWFQQFDKVFTDPCHPEPGAMTPLIGPSASDLVDAIVSRPGLAPTTPTSTTLAGRSATTFRLMLSAPPRDCTNGTFLIWELPLGASNALSTGMSERVWVMDIDGERLVVTAVDAGDATAAQQQAIQQVLDSIQFEPAQTPSPSAPASP